MKISTISKGSFNSLTTCLKLIRSDFHIKQKRLLYNYKSLFLAVTAVGETLIP